MLEEDARDKLLRASPTTFSAFQGEAIALMAVREMIETDPPPIIKDN